MAKNEKENPKAALDEEDVLDAEFVPAGQSDEAETEVLLSSDEAKALIEELEAAKKVSQENLDSWQRERADFSNYRKRVERDQALAAQNYKSEVLKKFLVVLDDLNLAYAHRPEGEAESWADGIGLIVRKFDSVLENEGLEKIPCEPGTVFDANVHMAVSMEDSEEFESDTIIEVLQNGYKMGERIIRPAVVRVAK